MEKRLVRTPVAKSFNSSCSSMRGNPRVNVWRSCNHKPKARSQKPRAKWNQNQKPQTKKPQTKAQKPKTKSPRPNAKSQMKPNEAKFSETKTHEIIEFSVSLVASTTTVWWTQRRLRLQGFIFWVRFPRHLFFLYFFWAGTHVCWKKSSQHVWNRPLGSKGVYIAGNTGNSLGHGHRFHFAHCQV